MGDRTAEMIFDAFARASEAIHKEDARRRKLEDLRSASAARCGNCTHWMKVPNCPREPGIGSGKRGPSMSGSACSKFTRDGQAERALHELNELRGAQ